jgi:hypothetical protein
LETWTYFFLAVAILVFMIMSVAVLYAPDFIYERMVQELDRQPAEPDIKAEWRRLSCEGTSPIRVIALANKMADGMTPYAAAKHLTSAFHSQVKFLAKRGHLLIGFTFFLLSRKWAKLALIRGKYATEPKDPIDFEVLGAPDFGVATVPYVGWFLGLFGFKKQALEYLLIAKREALLRMVGTPEDADALAMALISAKLYALTHDKHHKQHVSVCGLHPNMSHDQLRRVAKHLSMSLDELREFCNMPDSRT